MFWHMFCILHTCTASNNSIRLFKNHACASCIPEPTRSPQTYSISLDYRPAEFWAPTEEFHCQECCQIRSHWERIEGVLACVLAEVWIGPTAARGVSCRILFLSWALTGAALKLPRNRFIWLNVDPLLQTLIEWHFGCHAVKPNADLWPKHRTA